MNSIRETVTSHLNGATIMYLEEIVNHGIHGLTNDFHGDSEGEYEEFANEFRAQALVALERASK